MADALGAFLSGSGDVLATVRTFVFRVELVQARDRFRIGVLIRVCLPQRVERRPGFVDPRVTWDLHFSGDAPHEDNR